MRESPDRQPERAESPDYLHVIRARAWVIVLAVAVVVGATLILSYRSAPEYQASSQLLFKPNTWNQAFFGAQVSYDSNQPRDVETGAKLVKIEPVAQAVKEQLSLPYTSGQLLAGVEVTTSSADNLLQITVTGTDPQLAAQVANAFAEQFVIFRRNTDQATVAAARDLVKKQLDSLTPEEAQSDSAKTLNDKYTNLQILEAMQTGGFSVVQTAVPPQSPSSPKPMRDALLALAVGIILGLGVAFLLDHADKSIRDVKTLERTAAAPVLATVPQVGSRIPWLQGADGASKCVGFVYNSILLESFRILRSSLKYFEIGEAGRGIKTILVASGESGQGKTVTSINLALSLTIAGNRVLLIDADLRHPKVAQHLGLRRDIGLSTVLSENATFMDVLQPVNVPQFVPGDIRARVGNASDGLPTAALFCLASGPLPPNPAEILGSSRMDALINELAHDCMVDYVVIDSAPILAVADALLIAPKVDAVLVAARLNRITRDEVQQVDEQLKRSGARVIGMVVAGVKVKPSPYYKQNTSAAVAKG